MTSTAGSGSLGSLRRVNRGRVLRVLQERGAASRVDLVRATGLSRTAVSSLVADLIEGGVVVEGDAPARRPSPGGRRTPVATRRLQPTGALLRGSLGDTPVRPGVWGCAGLHPP